MGFVDDHPTHWWVRPDIIEVVEFAIEQHGGTWNSYWDHPPGWGLDYTSVDVWGDNGRGDPIGADRLSAVAWELWDMPGTPFIRWQIVNDYIYYPDGSWFWFSSDTGPADMAHRRHVHTTYW